MQDNFLSKTKFKEIKSFMLESMNFPWYYNNSILYDTPGDFQFIHNFFRDGEVSNFFSILDPLLEAIKPSALYRVKANLGTRSIESKEQGYHTDFDPDYLICKTAVLYLNTNNGYTIFESGERVESIENRLLIFDSPMKHSGASQTDTNIRSLINLNFDL